ncbi:MAG: hypothetical protein P4L85_08615 [Paludisphaera borealis]|uniref:hypothetical protein n=1 Tax=Paludisphaera borealis TaxID=1387353 RepID=UPI00283F01CE|nr:hypothetical protein [Paludisphaera borealis]MDR3619398.1 hypothetical protein [Paludisphaera borealis]
MEASLGSNPIDLSTLRLDVVRQAAEIYVKLAYPSGQVPEAVDRRMTWSSDASPAELLSKPPFERAGRVPGTQTPIYALRLGNARYPHMKLQIQPWPNASGLMLSVNTHDQVAGMDLLASDGPAFKQLQSENQHLKEVIEQAWEAAGLPTFLQYLREYIESRTDESTGSPDAAS